jgi:DNA mismatch repair protein MutS2
MDSSLDRLEFTRILTIVANLAGSEAGRDLVLRLRPAPDREGARILREETLHAAELISIGIEPPVSYLQGIIEAVDLINRGTIALEPVHLRCTGEALADMKAFLEKTGKSSDGVSGILDDVIGGLPMLESLSTRLIRITTPDGELASDASPELKRITGRIQSLRSSLSAKISAISARLAGSGILRDFPASIRTGRYVLPVASAKKSSVKGLIHDRSESGATLFIEPAELIEDGNELQESLMDLQQERRRILREATLTIRERLLEIEKGISILSSLDFVFARARYHKREKTVFPEEGRLDLRGLAHPLLPAETVVKSRVSLASDWRVLVVSGPNAGGKSVLLKAISLASVFSRSGLGVHAGPASSMPFFSKVMVSMGDNQSIAMQLSTYSARLSEQKSILEGGDHETLAIVDEPAAGTDPATGAALAAVFLQRLADSGVRTIVSTHMGQLKLLAMEKPGFYNGSMSFIAETLTPGFEFIAGIPGASCTLEAAAIAGFPRDLLDEAFKLAGDSFSLDSLVMSLRDLQESRQKELEQLRVHSEQAIKSRKSLENQLSETRIILKKKIDSLEEEKIQALKRIQSMADSLLVSIANSPAGEERKDARRKVNEATAGEMPAGSSGKHTTRSLENTSLFQKGDHVQVEGWPRSGLVENVSRSTAMVRLGSMLVKKDLSLLTKLTPPADSTVAFSEYQPIEEKAEAVLLGMTVDEAIVELDIKLDNYNSLGLKRLRIVHGKGRLMLGVTDWLRRDRRVKSLTIASPEEGGTGASIVFLKG